MTESDGALLARAQRSDPAAFELLLRRHVRVAYLVAMAQLGERADAEDACQDAFVRAWERLAECRDPERFGAWLMRIVRNTAINRRAYLRLRATESLDATAHVSKAPSPALDLERRELARALRGALAQLRDPQGEVVLLHDLEGWRHAQIAALLEISEEMSRRHLSDARKHLRMLIGREFFLENQS